VPSFRTGAVTAVLEERRGFQRVEVDGEPAYVLTDLVGDVALGDRVVMNTTAVELGLGTGGWHVVHWNLTREALHRPGRGHVMKLRYTSLQADTGSAEERREIPDDLNGAPVVVLALHSQLAAVAMAVAMVKPGLRVVYVMTDAGALPIAFRTSCTHCVRRASSPRPLRRDTPSAATRKPSTCGPVWPWPVTASAPT